ncbi:MAG: Ig-like domain-containing protein [bacterium]
MKKFVYFLIICAITSCAVIDNPSGGPKDTQPPTVVSSYPVNQTTEFKDNKLQINFSEYTNKQTVIQNIYITPKIEFDSKWKRKKLFLYLKDELNPAITYTLTLGTEYTDMVGNKPKAAYAIIFSRGTKIDTGKITGNVYMPTTTSYVFAYKLTGIKADTLNITHTKPDYIIPLGSSGDFTVNALKDGEYRLFAIDDKFKDGIYDINTDGFSTASRDYKVENAKAPTAVLRMGGVFDVIRPSISSFEPQSNNLYKIQLSEKFAKGLFKQDLVTIENLQKTKQYKDFVLFNSPKNPDEFYIYTKSALDTNEMWQAIFSNVLIDSAGNFINDSTRKVNFTAISPKMALVPKLEKFAQAEPANVINPNDTLTFEFNYPIIVDSISNSLSIYSAKDSVMQSYKLATAEYPNIIKIIPIDLKQASEYFIKFNPKKILSVDGSYGKDSAQTFIIKTINPADYSTVSGTLQTNNYKFGNWIIKLSTKTKEYTIKPDSLGNWKIDNVIPESYTAIVFFDTNGNQKIDNGRPWPYEPSEISYYLKEPIVVKKGWNTDNVKLIAK